MTSKTIQIRRPTLTDAVLYSSYRKKEVAEGNKLVYSLDEKGALEEILSYDTPTRFMMIALYDGEIIGEIQVTCVMKKTFASLHLINVNKDFRGKGLGRKLLELIHIHLKGVRSSGLSLLLDKDQGEKLESFYVKNGYRACGNNTMQINFFNGGYRFRRVG